MEVDEIKREGAALTQSGAHGIAAAEKNNALLATLALHTNKWYIGGGMDDCGLLATGMQPQSHILCYTTKRDAPRLEVITQPKEHSQIFLPPAFCLGQTTVGIITIAALSIHHLRHQGKYPW